MLDWLNSAALTVFGEHTTWSELLGFATGLVDVWLVVRQHVANWPLGIANVLLLMVAWGPRPRRSAPPPAPVPAHRRRGRAVHRRRVARRRAPAGLDDRALPEPAARHGVPWLELTGPYRCRPCTALDAVRTLIERGP